MRRSVILLCLVLCVIALWLLQRAVSTHEPDLNDSDARRPAPPVATTTARETPTSSPSRKPLQIRSKGKVRLRPGESAVRGYWEIAPGMNGLAIVTPETTPEGQVKMTTQLLHLSDAAVSDVEAQDLLPDLFDFENYGAIGRDRWRGLQTSLQGSRGVDLLTAPTLVSQPGQRAMISIGHSNASTLSLSLQADPLADDGGYDLSLELQRQE